MNNNTQGQVIKLYITKNDEVKTRVSIDSISLDSQGIIDDKFYAKDNQRAVLITSQDSYKLAKKNNITINAGVLGENILIDINPYMLVGGERIQIGNAILEITQNCTLCKGLTTINSKLPKLLKNDRGIFATLIGQTSTIKVGDKVKILDKETII
ncbi:MOSC domain-containing protein [Sulfurimonas sp.]